MEGMSLTKTSLEQEVILLFPKKPLSYLFIIVLTLLLFTNNLAFSSSGSGADSSAPLSRLIPPSQTYHMEVLTFGLKVHSSAIYHITVDEETGDVDITATSDDFQFKGHFDSSLGLRDTATVYSNPRAVEVQGYDKRTALYDTRMKQVTLKYYIGPEEVRSKTFGYDQRMVDSEAFFVYLQGMLLKGVKEFRCGILLKLKGMKLDAAFKLLENVSLSQLEPPTNCPDFFQDLIISKERFDVYEMRLTGIVGLFYPHKFYFAYRKSPAGQLAAGNSLTAGCSLVAYWCGAGSEEEYYRFD